MRHYLKGVPVLVLLAASAGAQSQTPNVSQVLMYSGTTPSVAVPGATSLSNAVPNIFTETKVAVNSGDPTFGATVTTASNFTVSRSFDQLNNALNASIATALSIIPLSSPASGVIVRKDPATGAELPASSTLGPIFTERAETIGKGHFYIGFSNQDYHFTKYNGTSLNALGLLYTGGDPSKVTLGTQTQALSTVPATFSIGMDVRLSQDITFLTYGVTDSLDVSVGLPVVHSAVAARTFNGMIYAGNGAGNPTCWCANTFTPGSPSLILPSIGQSSLAKTGFGDVLLRVKGTVVRKPGAVVAIGGDLRLPSGDAANYLGVGTTTVKPFAAVSFYSKPMANGIVFSPHFDLGWQFSGKSILGGNLSGSTLAAGTVNYTGAPFIATKDYLPDVFTWAAGAEVALGRHNTLVADILGNEVGLIHGIPLTTTQTISNVFLPTGPTGGGTPTTGSASGLVSAGQGSFGQYILSLGYKARIVGNLVANFNYLIRLDNSGLVARATPMFGLGYSF